MSSPNIPSDRPLTHTDYPNVQFWFRRDWINRKKETSGITKVNPTAEPNKGRAPSGLNVTLRYVEDVDGVVVDGYHASEMRKFARAIWNQLHGAGKAPRSWGKADLDVATHYRREMRRRFPELGLCEFDWKAEQLATDNYPNWASNNFQAVKSESSEPSLTHNKRRRDSVGHISKRAKTRSISPTPITIDSAPSSNVVSDTTDFPPIDPGIIVTPANISPSSESVTQPAMLPSIIVSVHPATPTNIEEPIPAVALPTPTTSTMGHEPLSFDVVKDGAAAAAKTDDSSQVANLPNGDASISRMNMPRVRVSLNCCALYSSTQELRYS